MKYVFFAWAIPMGLFWGWYFISYYDLGAGYFMLSQSGNELVFNIYGEILGLDPATIPWLVGKACIIDTLLIAAIWAFRRRREIGAWWRRRGERASGATIPG
jgi:hypothetical protein